MQKQVSKQSLAMVALSILLAISIALTFTFAAFVGTKTATGTITFSAGGTLEWSVDTVAVDSNWTGNVEDGYLLSEENASDATIGFVDGNITLAFASNCFSVASDELAENTGYTATLKADVLTQLQYIVATFTNNSDSETMYYTFKLVGQNYEVVPAVAEPVTPAVMADYAISFTQATDKTIAALGTAYENVGNLTALTFEAPEAAITADVAFVITADFAFDSDDLVDWSE